MYTSLILQEGGKIPLVDRHVRRLGLRSRESVLKFAAAAPPGVYRLTWTGAELLTEARGPSRLAENMPVRFVVSPYVALRGRFAKPAPPNRYESVRVPDVSTLLTNEDGRELYESDSAALVAWNGSSLVLTPLESPGVKSLAEEAVVDALPHTRAMLLREADWPLLLINAVAGTCAIDVPGRAPFPTEIRARIHATLTKG